MRNITVLDEIQLKTEFRHLYKNIGVDICYQTLYELLKAAEIMCEMLKEENEKKS